MTQVLQIEEPLPDSARPKHRNKKATIEELALIAGVAESQLRLTVKQLFDMLLADARRAQV